MLKTITNKKTTAYMVHGNLVGGCSLCKQSAVRDYKLISVDASIRVLFLNKKPAGRKYTNL